MYFTEWQRWGLRAQAQRSRRPTALPSEAAGPSANPGPVPFIKHVLIFKKQHFPAKANFKGINAH